MIKAFRTNWKLYLMEAFGLFIFMVSACFFSGMLEHHGSSWNLSIPNPQLRNYIMALAMSITAGIIFFSPFTAPSGAFINPSVALMRWRLGQLSMENLIWYSIFETIGGLLGVYVTYFFLKEVLADPPVNFAVTVPGKGVSNIQVIITETLTAFLMITMVLFTSENNLLKKATPVFAAILVGVYVLVAGPISGFGMNPARTIASAIPAGIYTSFWIYMVCPTVGMLLAAECYIWIKKKKPVIDTKIDGNQI